MSSWSLHKIAVSLKYILLSGRDKMLSCFQIQEALKGKFHIWILVLEIHPSLHLSWSKGHIPCPYMRVTMTLFHCYGCSLCTLCIICHGNSPCVFPNVLCFFILVTEDISFICSQPIKTHIYLLILLICRTFLALETTDLMEAGNACPPCDLNLTYLCEHFNLFFTE